MTSITSPNGEIEIINARRTESLDAPSIQHLINQSTESLFGHANIMELIEKALLAVTLCNEKEEIIAQAVFYDYPNHRLCQPDHWEPWLQSAYAETKSNAFNSLFLHHFTAREGYASGCTKEIVRTVFNAAPTIQRIYLVLLPGSYPDQALKSVFSNIDTVDKSKCIGEGSVFVCYRHNYIPKLHVRHAKVEDHDDLTPIFNRQNDMLKKTYGDYFLAEMIESQDEHMHCLAVEVEGTAIGLMSVSDQVNFELLNRCFELGAFHGLRKPHADDKLEDLRKETPPLSARRSVSPEEKLKSELHIERIEVEKSLVDSLQASAKSSLLGDVENQDVFSQHSDSIRNSPVPSVTSPVPTPERLTPQIPPSTAAAMKPKPIRFQPTYFGESNACVVQLFAIDEKFEQRAIDFLPKVFELFPSRDFLIVTVPHLVPEFPLLGNFVRVTPRFDSTLSQELYVFHKAGLATSFHVRRAFESDFLSVQRLAKTLHYNTSLLTDLDQYNKCHRDDNGQELKAFIAECCGQVVGVIIIRHEEDIEYLRSHYNIEDFIYYNHHKREEHGQIYHLAMNPIFSHLTKSFIKEAMRLGHKSCLYYPIFPAYETNSNYTLITGLNDLVPIRARRQVIYPLDILRENAPSLRVLKQNKPFALNHINRKLIMEPKVTINARIVVVGASTTSLSFLECMTFCPHLRFNNLVLISPHGFPDDLPPDELADNLLATNHCYSQEQMNLMALRTWVNLVYGKMVAIDRKKKRVSVLTGNGSRRFVSYDHLVIASGTQFQVACPTGADVSKLTTSQEIPQSPYNRFTGNIPKNHFLINDHYDAAVALYWLEQHFASTNGRALVYGRDLQAYTCVQTLLDMGVTGDRIVLVKPPQEIEITAFNNPDVEEAVAKALIKQGVEVHGNDGGYLLAQWNNGAEGLEPEIIYSASFTSDTKPLSINCNVFFCYFRRSVDYDGFKAINDACLVFDNRLVIDAYSHTNDVSIRGAGPITKFQRVYHSDQWSHARFSSKEVGQQLAQTMLRLFDPTLESEPLPPSEPLKLIPILKGAKIQGARLPGALNYLHVAKPGLDIPLQTVMAHSDYGTVVCTGNADSDKGYFRIHINQFNFIETITCLSKRELPTSNIISLYGLHQRFLNNLVSRFNEGLISDLFSFINEPWCMAIFHDRFSDFRDEVRELLQTRAAPDRESLEEIVRKMMEDDVGLNVKQKEELAREYRESGAKRALETRFLSYINYNYYHLPMYAKPGMV